MGVQHTYGTAGATGGGWSAQSGSLQPAYSEQWAEPAYWYSWQARAPKTWKDQNRWVSQWPRGSFGMCGADASTPYFPVNAIFEPFSCDGPGTQTTKFLKGQCVDASDVALSGVVVQGFRTADDQYLGYDVQSRGDGSYDLPSNLPASASYVVAYLAGSPDRGGTTLNTLTPTNIDGS